MVCVVTIVLAALQRIGENGAGAGGEAVGGPIMRAAFVCAQPILHADAFMADLLARVGRKATADPALVFLAIDDRSVSFVPEAGDLEAADPAEKRALELINPPANDRGTPRWPWPREVHALILDRLVRAGARAVVFDLLFAAETPDDALFRDQLDRARDRVVLASNFVSDTSHVANADVLSYTRPAETLIANDGDPEQPHDDRVGFDNFWVDGDHVIRTTTYRAILDGHSEPALSLAATAALKAGLADRIPHGLEPQRLRFAGPEGTFPPRSVCEIFVPDMWRSNYANGEFFRDKIVIIGASGNWQHDRHATPLHEMPGAEIHLNALNALKAGGFIKTVSSNTTTAIVAACGAVAILLWLFVRSPFARLFVLVALTAGSVGAALLLWNSADLLVPLVAPLAALNISGITSLVADIRAERQAKAQIRWTLERYVSRNVARELMDHPEYTASQTGVLKPATVLFSDIRNFTQVSARTEPHALLAQLNEYLAVMVDCVFRHGGTLDKFIGDAIMAVWGNVFSAGPAKDAVEAVTCALAMRAALDDLNARWAKEARTQLQVGIALNHGNVIVGNIGSPQRMEFAVIGDAVNMTWKLQEQTKLHGCELLVGKTVADLIGTHFETEQLGVLEIAPGAATAYSRIVGPRASATRGDDEAGARSRGIIVKPCARTAPLFPRG
jgi:adenylate cyclase